MTLARVEGTGEAAIFRGDPRIAESDIDGWLTANLESIDRRVKARPHLYGSDAGFCARRNVLLATNDSLESSLNAAGMGYMVIGVAFENLLSEALQRANRLLAQNIYLVDMPAIKIRGKIDLVVIDHQEELALIEVKTCGDLPTEPKPTHLAQIQTYAAVSGIRKAYLTYMSRKLIPKKPIPLRTFEVDTSDEALENRLRIAFLSELALAKGRLPAVPSTFRKHTECHYCEFRDHYCWGGRGDSPPEAPLPDFSIEDLIKLDNKASKKAKELMKEIDTRREETVRGLRDLEGITKELLDYL